MHFSRILAGGRICTGCFTEGPAMGPLVEYFKTATLERSHWCILPVLGIIYLKNSISSDVLLMEGYAQGALRKGLLIDPFVECFEIATSEKS